ncbi:MAG: DMT family transporter [Chloroflexi bacterium]|nr:DMT family transporter [Chloroflexota bacterium]
MSRRLTGIVLIMVSAAGFGTLGILGRYAYAAGMNTFTVMFLRFCLSAAILAMLLVVRREGMPSGAVLFRLVGMGAIGYVGQAFCYLTALRYASAGLVALLLYLYPLFVAILSILFLHEQLRGTKILALGLALLGTALTAGPEGGQMLGILLAITAAIIYSVYILVGTEVMKRVSAIQSSAVIFASAGAVSGLLMAVSGPQIPTRASGWAAMLLMVLLATVVPVVTFLAGLERIGPTNASMLSTLEPVVTVLLAMGLLGERPRPVTLLGGALILAAVLLLARSELHQT